MICGPAVMRLARVAAALIFGMRGCGCGTRKVPFMGSACLIGAASVFLTGSAPAAEPWEGKWAADPEWCRFETGEHDPAPILLSKKIMVGLENSCEVKRIRRSNGAVTLSLACFGEGDRYEERIRLRLVGGRLQMQYLDRDNAVVLFHRCPDPIGGPEDDQ